MSIYNHNYDKLNAEALDLIKMIEGKKKSKNTMKTLLILIFVTISLSLMSFLAFNEFNLRNSISSNYIWKIKLAFNLNTPLAINFTEKDIDILVRTVIGEAQFEPNEGKLAIIWTVLNRYNDGRFSGKLPNTIKNICLARAFVRAKKSKKLYSVWQFSTWQNNDVAGRKRRKYLFGISKNSKIYKDVENITHSTLLGRYADPTQGALSYLNPTIVMKKKGYLPHCNDRSNVVTISNHIFCNPF